jgi:hypothetical protein
MKTFENTIERAIGIGTSKTRRVKTSKILHLKRKQFLPCNLLVSISDSQDKGEIIQPLTIGKMKLEKF